MCEKEDLMGKVLRSFAYVQRDAQAGFADVRSLATFPVHLDD